MAGGWPVFMLTSLSVTTSVHLYLISTYINQSFIIITKNVPPKWNNIYQGTEILEKRVD